MRRKGGKPCFYSISGKGKGRGEKRKLELRDLFGIRNQKALVLGEKEGKRTFDLPRSLPRKRRGEKKTGPCRTIDQKKPLGAYAPYPQEKKERRKGKKSFLPITH